MPKFFLGFLAGIVALAAALVAFFGVNSFTRLSGEETVEDTPAPTAPPANLVDLMDYSYDAWEPHGGKVHLRFYSEDDTLRSTDSGTVFTLSRVQPVRTLEIVDFERVCIADVTANAVTYGFDLWEETQQALLTEFSQGLERPPSPLSVEGTDVFLLGNHSHRMGQFLINEEILGMYNRKVNDKRGGFDFTVRLDAEAVYWFQYSIAHLSSTPLQPCDDTVDLSLLPEYQPLIDQFWNVEKRGAQR